MRSSFIVYLLILHEFTVGCGPTAQAAVQQGVYLGRLFRDSGLDKVTVDSWPSFRYINRGGLAYVGGNKGVAELKNLLWDTYPAVNRRIPGSVLSKSENASASAAGSANNNTDSSSNVMSKFMESTVLVNGYGAFALWRSLYFSRLLSARNRMQVAWDWTRTYLFGRTISSPYFEYTTDTNKKISKK